MAHSASGSFFGRAPLALSSCRFIIILIILLMASNWPFDCGWAGEAKNRLILRRMQNCVKCFESNCLSLSMMMAYGMSNRQQMWVQTKSSILVVVLVAKASASTHLVK